LVRLLPYSTQRLGDARSRFGPFRHPLACWCNPCDKLALWNISSAITASIEHLDKKEGTGSLKLVNDNVATEDLTFTPTIFTRCAAYFGFWIKFIDPPSDLGVRIQKRDSLIGDYESIRFYVSDGNLKYRPYTWTESGGYGTNGLEETILAETWYWFEIYNAVNYHRYYKNGVLRTTTIMAACNVDSFDKLEGLQLNGQTLGTILLDYWRLATIEQYLPT